MHLFKLFFLKKIKKTVKKTVKGAVKSVAGGVEALAQGDIKGAIKGLAPIAVSYFAPGILASQGVTSAFARGAITGAASTAAGGGGVNSILTGAAIGGVVGQATNAGANKLPGANTMGPLRPGDAGFASRSGSSILSNLIPDAIENNPIVKGVTGFVGDLIPDSLEPTLGSVGKAAVVIGGAKLLLGSPKTSGKGTNMAAAGRSESVPDDTFKMEEPPEGWGDMKDEEGSYNEGGDDSDPTKKRKSRGKSSTILNDPGLNVSSLNTGRGSLLGIR